MKKTKNILIVGVGGQGVLLASELLCEVAFLEGMDVKKSEVHGMAQRGGVVSSHIRFGKKVYSPLIPTGDADILLAFEKAEAKRWIHFIKPNGQVILNTRKLVPPVAFLKGFEYPSNPIQDVQNKHENVITVSAAEMAKSLGNSRVENTILLGAMSKFLDIPIDLWEKTIRERVPQGTENINIQAFQKGRIAAQ